MTIAVLQTPKSLGSTTEIPWNTFGTLLWSPRAQSIQYILGNIKKGVSHPGMRLISDDNAWRKGDEALSDEFIYRHAIPCYSMFLGQ